MPENIRVASETALPEPVAEDDDGSCSGPAVVADKRPTQRGIDGDDFEEPRCDLGGKDDLGLAGSDVRVVF